MNYLTLIDVVLAVTLFEVMALLCLWLMAERGVPPRNYLASVGSGIALMLALRAAMLGSHWLIVAAMLGLAGLIHAADLRLRWQSLPTVRHARRLANVDWRRLHEFALEKRVI